MADTTTASEIKKHAACDECRVRKLKCSGDQPRCSRCEREGIECVYSPQKQMGRPRKRKEDDSRTTARRRTPPSPMDNLMHANGDALTYLPPSTIDASAGGLGFAPAPAEQATPQLLPYTLDHPQASIGPFAFPGPLDAQQFPFDPALMGFAPPIAPNVPPNIDPIGVSGDFAVSPNSSTMTDAASSAASNIPGPQCACLPNMYLTMSTLQSLTSHTFPFALRPLKEAKGTAEQVLSCQLCQTDTLGGYLNVTIITTLLFALADGFRKVVEDIDLEATRAEESGTTKRFHLGDANPGNTHLHTATPDCPARFDLELDADGWRSMAKKVVRQEVYGSGAGGDPNCLVGLITRLEDRQIASHANPDHARMRERLWGSAAMDEAGKKRDWHCVKQARNIRLMVDRIPW